MAFKHHTVPARAAHTHTIIFLHGRDSVADEFQQEIFESQRHDDSTLPEALPQVKWVFPTAKPIDSKRFSSTMSQWFDMWGTEEPDTKPEMQIEGLRNSIAVISSIIDEEATKIPYECIFLGGISQGCATALYALLCNGHKLGGFIGLSSWMPLREQVLKLCDSQEGPVAIINGVRALILNDATICHQHDCLNTPVFLSHCEDDSVIAIRNGENLRDALTEMGFEVIWCSYKEGEHWLNEPRGVDDMVDFVERCISADNSSIP